MPSLKLFFFSGRNTLFFISPQAYLVVGHMPFMPYGWTRLIINMICALYIRVHVARILIELLKLSLS